MKTTELIQTRDITGIYIISLPFSWGFSIYSVNNYSIRTTPHHRFNPTIAILLQPESCNSFNLQPQPFFYPPCLSKQSCSSTYRRPTKSTSRFSATSATRASCTSSCSREMPTSNMPLSTLLRYVVSIPVSYLGAVICASGFIYVYIIAAQ